MNIAVIGSGGREHAIFWKLSQSKLADKVFVIPGNGGTENNVKIDVNNFEQILHFCRHNTIELLFVGPEDPLANGIVDFFADTPVKVFGPDKAGAQLESSKIYAKQFMQKYGVSTSAYQEFCGFSYDESDKVKLSPQEMIAEMNGNCVIKYDGLAAGKGVFVCSHQEEAISALNEIHSKYGEEASYLIEERLEGDELSILAFTDGKNYKLMQPSQDHKQLLDGDKGPNTGGMGAFCPVPFVNEFLQSQIEKNVIEPTMEGIKKEDFKYVGIIYFGLMITQDGPKLLEYNVRLGDPETEVVLPAMKSDLLELILSCFDGSLSHCKIEFNEGYFVDVVLVSGGYPAEYKKGLHICGIKEDQNLIFHAGTKKENFQVSTSGGRVLNVVAQGKTLETAIDKAYDKVNDIYFEDIYFRKDIGRRKSKLKQIVSEN